jgi:hypothetical protein
LLREACGCGVPCCEEHKARSWGRPIECHLTVELQRPRRSGPPASKRWFGCAARSIQLGTQLTFVQPQTPSSPDPSVPRCMAVANSSEMGRGGHGGGHGGPYSPLRCFGNIFIAFIGAGILGMPYAFSMVRVRPMHDHLAKKYTRSGICVTRSQS